MKFNKKNIALIVSSAIACACLIITSYCVGVFSSNNSKGNKINYQDYMGSLDYGDITYVIGHKSPDSDTVLSAIAYANLKQELDINCVPAISGKLNNETKYVLDYFDVETPQLLTDATDKHIIMVDHSTYTQAIDGMANAHVVELLDHHGLGNLETASPIYIKNMAVGATATIVYLSYLENNVSFDKTTAGILASAILSDTNNLTSSTTTPADTNAYNFLAPIAEIKNQNDYYKDLLEHLQSYDGMSDEEIFHSDYKEYEMSGKSVGIASVNANGSNLESLISKMQSTMGALYTVQGMDHLYTIVNDANNNRSFLIYYGDGAIDIVRSAFKEPINNRVEFEKVVSRKKDIVPNLEAAYSK